MSELSQQEETAGVVDDEWDMDWFLDQDGVDGDDPSSTTPRGSNGGPDAASEEGILFVEAEGKIDLHSGLSQFVQFIASAPTSATKQQQQQQVGYAGNRLMDRVMRDDVAPCLRLHTQEDRAYRKLLEAVWNNHIFLEPLAAPAHEVCTCCGMEPTSRWRLRTGNGSSQSEWKVLGDLCRERIVRTCDFYTYLRNIRQGLVKKTLPQIYKEYLRLRLMMNFARVCAG